LRLTTLGDFLSWAERSFLDAGLFFGHGTDNAWDEAVALARFVLKLAPDVNRIVLDRVLDRWERKQLLALVEARIYQRIPVPYLVSEAYFAGLKFYVDKRVIIPRSPFAELILNGFEPWLSTPPERILDLCCGSACIAIACAKAFPEAMVDALDVSEYALAVARHNIDLHGVVTQVYPLQSDLWADCTHRYDIIISNPPYVSTPSMAELPAEYRFEPRLALEAGLDGLDVVDRILAKAKDYLKPNGLLVVEVGSEAVAMLEARYPQLPFTWLDFEQGAEGVFLLSAKELP
jgi:ribosomal protein L3 glutamine methyltransferase